MSATNPDPTDTKTMRRCARRSEKVGAIQDAANIQLLRERLWNWLLEDVELKEIRLIISCLFDLRRMIALDERGRADLDEYGPGEQEQAVIRIFGELPEPDCSAVASLEHDITASSGAPGE